MIFALLILLFYTTYNLFDALWDTELLKPGESNHFFKSARLVSMLLICACFGFVGYDSVNLLRAALSIAVLCFVFPFLRYAQFDFFINHFRGKDENYKTGPLWSKWVAILIVLILLTLYYFL